MIKTIFIGKSYGYSMKPIINQGDSLHVAKVKKNDLKRGDIIVFYQGKKLICHRLIRKKDETVLTKGDNNPFFDRPIGYGKILGSVNTIDGVHGRLHLKSKKSRFIRYYFLFFSLITYYPPRLLGKLLSFIFRDRGILVRLLKKST